MNRRKAILGAAGLGLGLAMPAHAQLALDWIDTPSADDDRTKRLEDEAVSMAKADGADTADRTRPPTAHPHTVSFDYVYPVALNEYRALGANWAWAGMASPRPSPAAPRIAIRLSMPSLLQLS